MILVRIDRVVGDVAIPGYTDYFLASGFEFGVGREISASEGSSKDLEESSKKDQSLSISKHTDAATVYLMQQAMKSRSQNSDSAPITIDIVLVEVRGFSENGTSAADVNPYLQIRIENAFITNWSLSGDGDDRPTESLEIWFSRAAIKYWGIVVNRDKSKSYKAYGPVGWDQYDNVDFKPSVLS